MGFTSQHILERVTGHPTAFNALRSARIPEHCRNENAVLKQCKQPLNPIQLISLNAVLVDCKHPLAFIEYFNETMAKPFKWTYKGKPLAI